MAYLAEQTAPADTACAVGVYVSGTTIGGLMGRLVTGPIAEFAGWRIAMLAVALASIAAAVTFVLLAPRGARGRGGRGSGGAVVRAMHSLRTSPLPQLYAQPFLLMGVFVALYNYLGFRLEDPPFGLSATAIALLYLVYLAGTLSSARAGALVQRFGFRRTLLCAQLAMVLGLAAVVAPSVPVIVAGLILHTAGFFAAHATVSAWVPLAAPAYASEASASYSFAYYVGSSVLGWVAGLVLAGLGWGMTVACLAALVGAAAILAATVREPGRGIRPPVTAHAPLPASRCRTVDTA